QRLAPANRQQLSKVTPNAAAAASGAISGDYRWSIRVVDQGSVGVELGGCLLALAQQDDIGPGSMRVLEWHDLAEETRGHVPLPPIIGDDRHRLLVVARHHAFDMPLSVGLEVNPITDPEFQHLRVGPHLVEQAEPRDDAMVEVDQFGLAKLVDVDLHTG